MHAEMLGMAGAREEGYRVLPSDSQAATRSCRNLPANAQGVRSWIDGRVHRAAKGAATGTPCG